MDDRPPPSRFSSLRSMYGMVPSGEGSVTGIAAARGLQYENLTHTSRHFRFLKRLSKLTYYTETQKHRCSLPGALSKNTLKILKSPLRTTCPRNGRCAPKFRFAQEASLDLRPISACSQAIFLVDQRGDLCGTAYATRNMSVPGAQNSSRMCKASQGTRGAPKFRFAQEASLGLQQISACSQAIFLVDQRGDLCGTAYAARNMSVPGAQNSRRMCMASQGTRGAPKFRFAPEASLDLQSIFACSQAIFLVELRGDLCGTAYGAR